jgi:FkbM family methyltransferase
VAGLTWPEATDTVVAFPWTGAVPHLTWADPTRSTALKAKEFVYLLGLKPRPKHFGFVIETHDLPTDGQLEIARWLHPGAYRISAPQIQRMADQLRKFLRAGDVAIDIGAHSGDTTIPIALAVGPSGVVLALEPNPYVFPVLERNASLNPAKIRIVPLRFAAMRADGRYEFQYGEEGYCNGGFHEGMSKWVHGSAFKVEIEGRNLLDFMRTHHPDLIPRLRFIKVDAEGFDLAILQTLEDLIRERQPFLQVEMFSLRKSTPDYRRQLYDFLVSHGYAVHRMESDGEFLGERVTRGNMMRWDVYDVFGVPAA